MDKQRSIFENFDDQSIWKVFVDGASRGNPGHAGAGIVISKNNELIQRYGYFLGEKTNNQAEYFAFLLGIFFITEHFHIKKNIVFFSDSDLIVRQIKGDYRVKNELLLPLYNRAKNAIVAIDYKIKHIPRSENSYADKMANTGIDQKKALPVEFLIWLQGNDL